MFVVTHIRSENVQTFWNNIGHWARQPRSLRHRHITWKVKVQIWSWSYEHETAKWDDCGRRWSRLKDRLKRCVLCLGTFVYL